MTASTFIFQLVPNLAVKVRSYWFAESANRHAVCVGEMHFTLMHSLTFLARGSAQLVAERRAQRYGPIFLAKYHNETLYRCKTMTSLRGLAE